MSEITIHFDSAREASELMGHRGEALALVEEALGITTVSRDTWVRLEGEEEKTGIAERFFMCMRRARALGVAPNLQRMQYALNALREGRDADVEAVFSNRIEVGPKKPFVFPSTFGQHRYVEAIRGHDIVFGIGPAGTGKTYLAMAMAVSALLREEVGRIIMTRPAIEAGEALGYLPGDMLQKVSPYLRPLNDALLDMLDAAHVEKFETRGVIEVAPLAYMRGRTLNHAFVILDEAQNTTPEQMFMFLTRLGHDSKCVVTGDLTQIDLPVRKQSGLLEAKDALHRVRDIAFVELSEADVVRHALVQKIIEAYRLHRDNGTTDA